MMRIYQKLLNILKPLKKSKLGNNIKHYLELSKPKIMIPVSLTGFTGYFIFDPHLTPGIIITSLGILLLAVSASVLNQIQEVGIDSKMKRTLRRPLPSGIISIRNSVIFFSVTFFSGIMILWSAGNPKAAIIGLVTILWYNGVYTYSKRVTAFAVVPGAVTGALPPLIGWVAAGGDVWDKPIIFVEFLFFVGQIPHFWLLILKYGEEYKNAGMPSLTGIFTKSQINRLTFTWIVTSVIAALFLCFFEIINSGIIAGILLLASAFLIWQFTGIIRDGDDRNQTLRYSIMLDSYFFLILILLIADRIVSSGSLTSM
jgi:protoheme IX farnesyltransferase